MDDCYKTYLSQVDVSKGTLNVYYQGRYLSSTFPSQSNRLTVCPKVFCPKNIWERQTNIFMLLASFGH